MLCKKTMSIDGWLELVEVSVEKQAERLKTGALLEAHSNWYHINLPRKLPWREQCMGKINAVPHILQICRTRGGHVRSWGPTQSLLETEGSETLTLQLRTALLARHDIFSWFLMPFYSCIHVSWRFCSCLCILGVWGHCLWLSTQFTLRPSLVYFSVLLINPHTYVPFSVVF